MLQWMTKVKKALVKNILGYSHSAVLSVTFSSESGEEESIALVKALNESAMHCGARVVSSEYHNQNLKVGFEARNVETLVPAVDMLVRKLSGKKTCKLCCRYGLLEDPNVKESTVYY